MTLINKTSIILNTINDLSANKLLLSDSDVALITIFNDLDNDELINFINIINAIDKKYFTDKIKLYLFARRLNSNDKKLDKIIPNLMKEYSSEFESKQVPIEKEDYVVVNNVDNILNIKNDNSKLPLQENVDLKTKNEELLAELDNNIIDFDKCLELIRTGADINIQTNICNHTILHMSILRGNMEAAKTIINLGADVNIQDKEGETALYLAVHLNRKEIIEELIKAGANLNIQDIKGRTALHLAVLETRLCEYVNILIGAGADLNIQDNEGGTPLHVAIYSCTIETKNTMKFIKAGANLNIQDNKGKTALHNTAIHNNKTAAQLLIKAGADLEIRDNEGFTPTYLAINMIRIELAEILIKAGADMKNCPYNLKTVMNVYYLSECNFQVNGGYYPYGVIIKEIHKNNPDFEVILKTLSSHNNGHKVKREDNGNTILHLACRYVNSDYLKKLLSLKDKSKFDLNVKNKIGNTPLHMAIDIGNVSKVEELIKAGADLEVLDDKNYTPLQLAITKFNILYVDINNRSDIIKLLVDAGANCFTKVVAHGYNEDIITFAKRYRNPQNIVKYLEENINKIKNLYEIYNEFNKTDWTANKKQLLQYASSKENEEFIKNFKY